ncbi:MAG: 1-acyl-sn-glycerol-3-phosphate acyltransferase [Gordonia sp. (in: high G+C Gram-positive bacteria)]
MAGNHISILDGILLWGALRRRAMAIAMAELWAWPVVGTIIRRLDFIPVDRAGRVSGTNALARLETALNVSPVTIIGSNR